MHALRDEQVGSSTRYHPATSADDRIDMRGSTEVWGRARKASERLRDDSAPAAIAPKCDVCCQSAFADDQGQRSILMRTGRLLLISLLVLVNAGLVTFALVHPSAKTATFVQGPATTASPHPKPTLPSVSAARIKAVPTAQSTLLSALTAERAWHALPGCTGLSNLAVTRDGGQTWRSIAAPTPHILAMKMTGPRSGWVIGANTLCQATRYATTDGGLSWHAKASVGSIWLAIPTGVLTPSGAVTSPCASRSPGPAGLAPANSKVAVVICARGVYRTRDGGKHWVRSGKLPDGHAAGAALAPNAHGAMFLSGSSRCHGARVARTTDGGQSWVPGACLVVAKPPIVASLGPRGQGLMIATGGTYRTVDYGASWD